MRPLKLTWRLSSPMAGGPFPLHLDALIAYAVTEEALREGSTSKASIRSIAENLPLEKMEQDGTWCWKASAIIGKTLSHSTRMWTRKTDPYEYAAMAADGKIKGRINLSKRYACKINMAGGIMKQHFQFFPVRIIDEVNAWCIGDYDRLLELLSPETGLVIGLGARVRSGFGRIAQFKIEEDESAYVLWKQRVLPWQEDGLVPIPAAYKPPYWAGEHRTTQSWIAPNLLA